jgi:tripeptide aminopeptidase
MKNLKKQLLDTFLDTIKINEIFTQEDKIIKYVINYAKKQGVSCEQDSFGNVICHYPGEGDSILLNTHLDIPEPAENIAYTIDGDILRSNGKTILGADPKSGVAVLLELIKYLKENNVKTRPIEFVFTLGEEAGLVGARHLDYSMLKSKMGLVIDEDGQPVNLITGAIGNYDINVTVHGKTVHSRDWKDGLNAIEHISKIIANLKQGEIVNGVTFNIGLLHGGTAVNSVAGKAHFDAEFRSFDMEKMRVAVDEVEKQIKNYCKENGLEVDFKKEEKFSSYKLERDHELFKLIDKTYKTMNMKANFYDTFGGSDSNIFNANGIKTVAIGSGYYLAHQYHEYINLQDMEDLLFFLAKFVESN